jgi:tRNA1Val (adenine37-N6)-methyltransferase
VVAARMLLGRRGRACFVYPAREMVSLFESLRASGLEPKRVRAVRATEIEPARIVLVEAMAAKAGGLVVEPDLVERCSALRGTPGYSPELARIIAGG